MQQLWGIVDEQQGAPAENRTDAPNVYERISKITQIWDRRQKVVAELQKTLCGDRNKENLIDSTCLIYKIVESTYLVQISAESVCFAMTIL